MEISVSELNELLQKEFDRGRQCPIPQINIPFQQVKDWKPEFYTTCDNIPEACKNCSNHPSNGGSGICHCILGQRPVMYTTTATSATTNCYNTKDE